MNYDLFSLIDQMQEHVPYPWLYYSVIEKDEKPSQLFPLTKLSFRIDNSFAANMVIQGDERSPVYLERHNFSFTHCPINPDSLRNCTGLGDILRWLLQNPVQLGEERQLENILNRHYMEFFSKSALNLLGVKPGVDVKNEKPYAENTVQRLMGKDFKPCFMGPFIKIEFYEPFKGYRKEPTFYFHVPWTKRMIAVGARTGSVSLC